MKNAIKSMQYALAGVKLCFQSGLNFRIHTVLAVIVITLAVLLGISPNEWIAVCFCIAFVVSMEMLNTALEKLCDLVHAAFHPSIKVIKDIAAGAVMVAAFFSVVTGGIIFLPKIMMHLK